MFKRKKKAPGAVELVEPPKDVMEDIQALDPPRPDEMREIICFHSP
jgi:hypothetical protein